MKIFETASFHITKSCNMNCKFCYATYNTFEIEKQISLLEMQIILLKLKEAGLKKITFAGGEPMLHKDLDNAIIYAKSIGLVTSIITNGSKIKEEWLIKMQPFLDWIGISIDSLNHKTNELIGRKDNMTYNYHNIISLINKYNYKLKINTVVNIFNQDEYMANFITKSKTNRWKVFDTLKVQGQNDEQFDNIKSTQFEKFIKNNKHKAMVIENNDLMTGSYLLIDPKGRFYENWGAKTMKSNSLITHSIEHCLNQISLNEEKFIERCGIYNW